MPGYKTDLPGHIKTWMGDRLLFLGQAPALEMTLTQISKYRKQMPGNTWLLVPFLERFINGRRFPRRSLFASKPIIDIVRISAAKKLKPVKGFKGEASSGNWRGFRSSRLNIQYRVIYKVQRDQVLVEIELESAA